MEAQWIIITAVVRFIFLVAPFLQRFDEFALTGADLQEAKELSNTANCRAMLASLPIMLFISVIAETDKKCPCGILPLNAMAALLFVSGLAYVLIRLPAWIYRGTVVPFLWFILITGLDASAQAFFFARGVQKMCATCLG